jgi:N-acetylglutamate synthase-like GNAT family acetyltransferase
MDETTLPEIKVRRAKPSDVSAIGSFLSDATHGRITADRAQIQERLGAKGFFLAQTTRIVGLASVRVENLVARVEDFIVHPVSQRPVVGKALLENIEAHANELQCEVVLLFVHVEASPAAYEFYQSCGFQESEMKSWPPAWLNSAAEFGGADRFPMIKRLREQLITRPI